MDDSIQQELEQRRDLWQTLLNVSGPELVEPGHLRELGISSRLKCASGTSWGLGKTLLHFTENWRKHPWQP